MKAYLDTVIPERVAQQLLEPSAVKKLLDEHLPSIVLCHANALHVKELITLDSR